MTGRGLPPRLAPGGPLPNNTAPLVVTAGSNSYCVWIWTPTPSAAITTTGSASCMPSSGGTIYSPANYPSDSRKVFVLVQSPRPSFFAHIVGVTSESVSAFAVAGGAHANYAVMALKPRLGTPDSQYESRSRATTVVSLCPSAMSVATTVSSGAAQGRGIIFTPGDEQVVDIYEPGTVQGVGSVVGGTIHQLEDYPIKRIRHMGRLRAAQGRSSPECTRRHGRLLDP